MEKGLNNSEPINLKGRIFICHELCNLKFDYLESKGLILYKDKSILNLSYNGKSKISTQDSFNKQTSEYQIKKIRLVAPSIHLVYDKRYPAELIITHQALDSDRLKHLTIFLEPSDAEEDRKNLSWKFFDKLVNQLPIKNNEKMNANNISVWNPMDLLPDENDRSFLTYNLDKNNNFVVFTSSVKVPTSFYKSFIRKIVGSSEYERLMNEEIPKNPPDNIVIFAKKNIQDGIKNNTIENYVSDVDYSYDEINYGVTDNQKEDSNSDGNNDSNSSNENNTENENNGGKEETNKIHSRYSTPTNPCHPEKDVDKKEEGLSGWQIFFITFGVAISIIIISLVIFVFRIPLHEWLRARYNYLSNLELNNRFLNAITSINLFFITIFDWIVEKFVDLGYWLYGKGQKGIEKVKSIDWISDLAKPAVKMAEIAKEEENNDNKNIKNNDLGQIEDINYGNNNMNEQLAKLEEENKQNKINRFKQLKQNIINLYDKNGRTKNNVNMIKNKFQEINNLTEGVKKKDNEELFELVKEFSESLNQFRNEGNKSKQDSNK